VLGVEMPRLTRPSFLAIVSSATLARYLARNASGSPDGFVVETPVAGGHNAPPRGWTTAAATPPVYGTRDTIDLEAIAALGLPFWLAGGYATPERLAEAQAHGAVGVQVGTAFAFCEESGLDEGLRRQAIDEVIAGRLKVRTDGAASPTGFPFKVTELEDTLSEPRVYDARRRRCDLGYLREAYRRDDGRVGYRCAAEPVDAYVRKGGDAADTVGRQCLCNSLVANIGLGQRRHDGYDEAPLLTAGDDASALGRLLGGGRDRYTAADVIDHLLGER
jgi:nitronate monooxygenase